MRITQEELVDQHAVPDQSIYQPLAQLKSLMCFLSTLMSYLSQFIKKTKTPGLTKEKLLCCYKLEEYMPAVK